jgi:hypothetical protein
MHINVTVRESNLQSCVVGISATPNQPSMIYICGILQTCQVSPSRSASGALLILSRLLRHPWKGTGFYPIMSRIHVTCGYVKQFNLKLEQAVKARQNDICVLFPRQMFDDCFNSVPL